MWHLVYHLLHSNRIKLKSQRLKKGCLSRISGPVEQSRVEASLNHTLNFSDIERFKLGNDTTIKYDPANCRELHYTTDLFFVIPLFLHARVSFY